MATTYIRGCDLATALVLLTGLTDSQCRSIAFDHERGNWIGLAGPMDPEERKMIDINITLARRAVDYAAASGDRTHLDPWIAGIPADIAGIAAAYQAEAEA